MLKFSTTAIINEKSLELTIQEMDIHRGEHITFYYIHHAGELIGVVSADGICQFEVIEGNYTIEQLLPICQDIKKQKEKS